MTLTLEIHRAEVPNRKEWDRYVMSHPRGLAYHLSGFVLAVQAAYRFDPVCILARQGSAVRGVLPLVHMRLPLGKGGLVSLPYCDAGGPVADTPEIEYRLVRAALDAAKNMGIRRVDIRSAFPLAGFDPALTCHPQKVRMCLPLPLTLNRSPDRLLASFKAKVRSQVKKPLRDGLTGELGGKELVRPFYRIFSENMRDLGSPVHSCDWILNIMTAFGNRAVIGLVRLPDGTPAAAGMILCHPGCVSIPWASSLRRYNRMNPNMLLYWQFLAFAAAFGYPVFDFGRSTPGQGTFRFKKQWGASPVPLHWVRFDPARDPISPISEKSGGEVSGSRQAAEAVLKRLPVPWLTFAGASLRRYISL